MLSEFPNNRQSGRSKANFNWGSRHDSIRTLIRWKTNEPCTKRFHEMEPLKIGGYRIQTVQGGYSQRFESMAIACFHMAIDK
ncbi:MAG: hypothetical protein JWM99_4869 [Verrucomicrobiales bacterium]|nr:hypothetical protein [Verrucomicrobiales bacterium]